jgi:TRAP-type C4-dicarboxylate transport system substrate-binding protein
MERRNLRLFAISVILILVVVSLLSLTACGSSSSTSPDQSSAAKAPTTKAPPTVIRAVSFEVLTNLALSQFKVFMDEFNKIAPDEITIQYVGGPEAIATAEQGAQVSKGVVDLVDMPSGMAADLIKGADNFLSLSTMGPDKERQNGMRDVLNKSLANQNLRYIARSDWDSGGTYLFTNKFINTWDDIPKIKMRVAQTNFQLAKALGFQPQVIASTETYNALQLGVVDGLITVPSAFVASKYWEVCKYLISPQITGYDQSIIMNLNTWNKLPDNRKKIITDYVAQFEPKMAAFWKSQLDGYLKTIYDHGVKDNKLSDADAKKFLSIAKGNFWDELKTDNPDLYDYAIKNYDH